MAEKPEDSKEPKLKTKHLQKEHAERIKNIIEKRQAWLRKKEDLAEFEQPVAILLRKTGKAEFYEKVTQTAWEIEHTDEKKRTILLHPTYLYTTEYGPGKFSFYICHEDHPTPLPTNPVLTSEHVEIHDEKVLADVKNWHVEEMKEVSKWIMYIVIGIAVVIGGIILYNMLVKQQQTTQAVQTLVQMVNQTIKNETVKQATQTVIIK